MYKFSKVNASANIRVFKGFGYGNRTNLSFYLFYSTILLIHIKKNKNYPYHSAKKSLTLRQITKMTFSCTF